MEASVVGVPITMPAAPSRLIIGVRVVDDVGEAAPVGAGGVTPAVCSMCASDPAV